MRSLNHHFVFRVLVPLILLVLVAIAAYGHAVGIRVFAYVGRVRVDTFRIEGRQRPRERSCLEVRYGRVPRGQVA